MRNISFMLTTEQIKNRTKTVTRRLGWKNLKVGELLQGCEKCQGLGKGGKIKKISVIRVKDVRREQLDCMEESDCDREGFPEMTKWQFIDMFCEHNKCHETSHVTRIEFEYIETTP